MKATFDVTVQIDGSNVGVSLSMRDGAEDVDLKVLKKLSRQLLRLKTCKIVPKMSHFWCKNQNFNTFRAKRVVKTLIYDFFFAKWVFCEKKYNLCVENL